MRPPWRYRLLVATLSPLLLGYTAWRALKDGGWRYWWERLGIYRRHAQPTDTSSTRETLWVHAASVGEVITVMPLIKAWKQQHPDTLFLVTTATPTGAAVLMKQSIPELRHQYLPVDFRGAGKRFLAQLPAHRGWIVETEIWPWLYAHCAQQDVSLTIVNGRLSDRTSTQAGGLLASSYRRALTHVRVLARSQDDADRFQTLGAPHSQLQVAGNLKYASASVAAELPAPLQLPYVLAASTHDDEELQLARAWLSHPDHDGLLVIVPRHPERGRTLQRELQALGSRASLRSAGELPQSGDRIHLADTLGEMQAWYQHAASAFVGGSLIERGGHNMLEPARYACPTVVGPHTGNFDDIMQPMQQAAAIHVAESADQVIDFLIEAADPMSDYRAMAQRALTLAEDSRRVLPHYLELLN